MTECLSPDEILRYVASTAADLDIRPFERHIDGCEACRRNVAGVVRANRNSAPRIDGAISDGTRIGRYVIRAVRGIGAMGHVFEASDPDLDRTIAIKIVHNTNAIDDTRALREGRALARLTHPNVVTVYDVGIWSGGVFLAMELVRGTTLREWAASPRGWREIVRVFAAVARGLHAAHGAGLVHRDIKPDNLVVGDDGRVRVIDFGLAIDNATEGVAMGGTPAYMAPEQRAALGRTSSVDVLGSTVASSPPGGTHLASLDPPVAEGTPRVESPHASGSTELSPPPRSASGVVADAHSDQYAFMVSLFETLEGKRPGPDVGFERGSPSWLRALIRRGLREAPDARHADLAAVARELEHGLGIRRRRAIIAGSVALVGGLAVAFAVLRSTMPTPAGPACTGASARLAGIWDAPRKQAIRTALLATRKPYAADAWRGVEQTLERYTAQWTAAHTETCEATHVRGEQSAELLDLRMACLDEHLEHLRSLGDVLAAGGPDIARSAVKAALALEPLERCRDAAALRAVTRPPADAAARKRIDDARLRLSQASALLEAGNVARAGSLADAIPELEFAPLDAERLLLIGRARRTGGEFDGALAALRASAREADAGGADTVRVNALVELIDVIGIRKGQHEQALEIAKDADALVLRMGRPPLSRALLVRARGSVLGRMGRSTEAVADLRSALADFELALGKDHLQSATTHNILGNALYREGRIDDAVASYRRALAIREAALGPVHPDTGGVIANLGSVLLNRRDFAGAEAAFRRARDIAIASLGPDHPDVALYHLNVALTFTQQRRFADALPEWQAADRLYTKKYGTRFHPEYVQAITGLAMARLGLDQPGAALADTRRAYELARPHEQDASPALLADLRFTLARAMWSANVDRAQARQHAIWARDVWVKGGSLKADELAEAEEWLRSRKP